MTAVWVATFTINARREKQESWFAAFFSVLVLTHHVSLEIDVSKRSPILGYNHNIRYRGLVFHVQTEDSGVDNPHIFTHVFHGGVILSTRKLDYDADSDASVVKALMQAQHKALLKALRGGMFDDKIDRYLSDDPALQPSPNGSAEDGEGQRAKQISLPGQPTGEETGQTFDQTLDQTLGQNIDKAVGPPPRPEPGPAAGMADAGMADAGLADDIALDQVIDHSMAGQTMTDLAAAAFSGFVDDDPGDDLGPSDTIPASRGIPTLPMPGTEAVPTASGIALDAAIPQATHTVDRVSGQPSVPNGIDSHAGDGGYERVTADAVLSEHPVNAMGVPNAVGDVDDITANDALLAQGTPLPDSDSIPEFVDKSAVSSEISDVFNALTAMQPSAGEAKPRGGIFAPPLSRGLRDTVESAQPQPLQNRPRRKSAPPPPRKPHHRIQPRGQGQKAKTPTSPGSTGNEQSVLISQPPIVIGTPRSRAEQRSKGRTTPPPPPPPRSGKRPSVPPPRRAPFDKASADKAGMEKTARDKITLERAQLDPARKDSLRRPRARLDRTPPGRSTLDRDTIDQAPLDNTMPDKTVADQPRLTERSLDEVIMAYLSEDASKKS